MAKPLEIDEHWADRIVQSVNGLEYGTVQIVVHDGRIVQIERTERKRFDAASNSAAATAGNTAKRTKEKPQPQA
ncbi:YezD family protein [Paenibacillus koleovorans]|uniref:YezD family protein n=1 Tax=Paenibacillus koleovorans TaxID=121608 RepID=UPI000FDB8FA5|nr:YezD family protein [Paenibacillus koleovorans]